MNEPHASWKQFRWPSGMIYFLLVHGLLASHHFGWSMHRSSNDFLWVFLDAVVWGWLLAGPLILAEQFCFAGREEYLSAGETLWCLYGLGWWIVGLGVFPPLALLSFLTIYCVAYTSWFWVPAAAGALIYHGIKRNSTPCGWTTFTGCASVLIVSGVIWHAIWNE